jgi:cytoskeletal protein RodZ
MSSPTHQGPASAGLGATLRAARSASGLSLAELERRTKIRAAHLSALEEERLDMLPPPPFVRGFVRTYAQALGLDPEPLLARVSELDSAAPGGSPWRPVQATIEPAQPASRLRRRASAAGIMALVVGIALAAFFAQQLRELGRPVQPAPPAPAATTAPGQPASPAAATPAAQPAAATPAPPAEGAGVIVEVSATGRSWLRVVGDGRLLFEGFVTAGESRRWQSPGPMTIRVGNAGAVVVTVNGRSVGTLGAQGEVVSRTFGKDPTR